MCSEAATLQRSRNRSTGTLRVGTLEFSRTVQRSLHHDKLTDILQIDHSHEFPGANYGECAALAFVKPGHHALEHLFRRCRLEFALHHVVDPRLWALLG